MSGERFIETPHLPKGRVKSLVIGERYREKLAPALESLEIDALWLPENPDVDPRLASHADLSVIYMGHGRILIRNEPHFVNLLTKCGFSPTIFNEPQGCTYPQDAGLNACFVGRRLFHRRAVTAPQLLELLGSDIEFVDVRQAYTKCSICVVDESSIITADAGIASAAEKIGVDVLRVTPGSVVLEGFEYGFIGGASIKLSENEMAFTGRLDSHPDKIRICSFLSMRGVEAVFLTDEEVFDIGSAILLTESMPIEEIR